MDKIEFRKTKYGTRVLIDGEFRCRVRYVSSAGTYEAWGNNGSKFIVGRWGSTQLSAVRAWLDAPVVP